MPPDTILVARTMGPAELIDYDRTKLRGLVIEDGSGQSHVAIVAKALGIAAVGQAEGIVERVTAGDAIIVDAVLGRGACAPAARGRLAPTPTRCGSVRGARSSTRRCATCRR